MAHHRQYSLQERLGNFIVKEEASQSNVERLHNFLKDIEPIKRKKIINAHLTPYYNRTSVHLAAEKGLAPFLHVLLKHGGDPNLESSLTDLKQTPLHLAAMGGYWQCMELLLEYKAELNVEDLHKRTPHDHIHGRPKCTLVVAQHNAKLAIPQRNQTEENLIQSLHKMMEDDKIQLFKETYNHLANHFKDLATRWLDLGQHTLLYSACYYDRKEIVKLILKESVHTPLANLYQGDTPLHCACNNDSTGLVEILLNHSPRLTLVCNTVQDKRYTPLHIVCKEKGNKGMVELLLQKISLLLETDEYSEDSPLDMNVCDANGCTPLYYACYYGHDEIVTQLLEFCQQNKKCRPFDVSVTTSQQRTPLHAAVQKNHISTLKILLDYCSDHKITSIINCAGYPSSHTTSRLLNCFPSVRSSITSFTSITSQEMEDSEDVFTEVGEEQHKTQSLSTNSNHALLAITKSDSHNVKSKVPHKPLKARAFSLFPISQQQLERDRSKTDISFHHMALYVTKDGTFLAHPTNNPPENVDKRFDEVCITPLAEACAFGFSQAVDMLLSAGASDLDGMAVRLAQLTGNYKLAHTVLSHHCTMIVETSTSEYPIYTLSIDWSDMKITELAGSGFVEESLFFPLCAKNDSGKDLLEFPKQLNASLLTNFAVNKNNLSSLPVELLQLPNVESLDVSSNYITSISQKISMNSLKFLYLSNNKLIKLPVTIWYLPNLLELKVHDNVLQSLEEDSIDPSKLSKSIKVVDISKNHFKVLPEFVLELSALEELNVSQNKLTKLPSNTWQSCTLRELNASNNHLFELPFCEPQSAFTSSLQSPNAALRHGKRFFGARMNVRFQTNGGVIQRRHTTKFVNNLEISQQVYSEEYIYNNEGCCSIEKLLLGRNNLSIFPDALPCLIPLLTDLDISHNKIEEIDILFLPPMLRKLLASNNKIKKFGNFVSPQMKNQMAKNCRVLQMDGQHRDCHHRIHKQMKNLAIVNLANNQLKHFQLIQVEQASDPPNITNYSQLDLLYPELENLDVSHNCLQGCFNHNIGYQSQLKSITLNDNPELEELPMEFANFKKSKRFTKMSLCNLPKLRDPPKEYHNKLRPLLSYMSSRLKKSEYYRFIKLIVVGCGERGKTTLLHRLRGSSIDNIDRTVGIDIEPWTYGQHHPITFITLDFAGQDVYNTTHQCFYSQRSLYLALYRLSDANGVAELDSWLRNIKLRAPGSPVIVIGTHLDQVKDDVAREREEQVKQHYSDSKLYPTIVDVCSVSSVKKGVMKKLIRSSIAQLRTTIHQIASHLRVAPDGLKLTYDQKMSQDDPESLFQQKIPHSYLKLQERVTDTLKTDKPPVMRGDEFRDKFLDIMDDEEELSDAVQYLHHQGTLLHFTDQALKDVYFLNPQWLCKMMASVIRVPPAGKKSIAKSGYVDMKDLFTESEDLQAFKDECINLLSKFDIALRLKNDRLLVPSLLHVDPPSSLPTCISDNSQLLNGTYSSNEETIVNPPLWKIWFSKFIPIGFWPRLICRLTTNQNINTILKSVFLLLVDDCNAHSSKDDMFLPWTLWRSGLALTCKNILLLEVKEVLNNSKLNENTSTSVSDCQFRVEVCVNIPGWVTVIKSQDNTADQDIVGPATSVMVEIVKHISSLATDWFPGIFDGYFVEGQVPCYVPCWKCCYQSSGDDAEGQETHLEHNITIVTIKMEGHTVYCWEFYNIITPAIKGKSIWCDLHRSIDPRQLTPELFFRDLDESVKNNKQPLWIDKERELGKGGFGVVLRGELETQEQDKIPVAIKVLLPQADSKLQHSSLEQVLKTANADLLIPQSYHDLLGVRINSIIPGTTPMILLMLELASSSLRDVLKKYKAANMLLEPVTLKATICQIASGLNYLHEHQIAHLDIKSPNILVWKFPLQFGSCHDRLDHSTEVLVKIADYGTSQWSTLDGIVANSSVGTPGYMAPELFSHQGQEISSSKVDVFAFGMTIFELLTTRPPFDEFLRKDANTLHKLVREGKRPLLSDKEAQSPVIIQDMMEMCWDSEPNNRPSMSQVLRLAESIEFESLRVDSNLAQVTAISTACVLRIDPEFDSCLERNGNDPNCTIMKSQTITQDSVTSSKDDRHSTDDTEIQPRNSRDRLGTVFRKVGSISELRLLPKGSSQVRATACTQIWLCGRDKRKGLVAIFTYEDDKPGYSLFYGYACTQEINVICAVYEFVWLGNANGELRIIHAPTMKTKFVRSLNSKESTSARILDIVHVKADRKVVVSTKNCDVWIFSDVLDKGGLRLYSHIQFPDEQEVIHMTVVDVNGSPEVWGTRSDNKMVVFQRHQSKWDYCELQCESFSGGLTVASSVFTGNHGDTKSHVWVSFNRRPYIVCWDAVKKKQLHKVDCKKDMEADERSLVVSSLLASGQFVYVGTSVGVIGVWSSEDARLLQKFHYHMHKVRMLLEMPLQVSACVCPEVPFLKDSDYGDIKSSCLITSIGNGHRKLLLHAGSTSDSSHLQPRHDDDICLLTWHCWK